MRINLHCLFPFLVCLLSSSVSFSAENLTREDLIGCWRADPPITHGEVTILRIDDDYHVTLRRNFDTKIQTARSKKGIRFYEDLAVAKLYINNDNHYDKLVGSGWKTQGTKAFFGTLYMYEDNKLFNGLPFQFMKVSCKEKGSVLDD